MKDDKIAKLEKKLQQQKQKLQQSEAYLREQKRKADIKRKIALGTFFYEAGLENTEQNILLGGLLFMQEKLQEASFAQECKNIVREKKEASGKIEKDDDFSLQSALADEEKF